MVALDANIPKPQAMDISIPTEEEILSQLKAHFGTSVSEKMLNKLKIHVYNQFIELNGQSYSGPAKENPIKPKFVINSYPDYETLSEREAIFGVFSPLSMHDFRGYQITVVHAIKRIQLAYITKQSKSPSV